MADEETPGESAPKKRSALPLVIGIVLALVLGGAGFYVTWSGMLFGEKHASDEHADDPEANPLHDITFVPIDSIIISLGGDTASQHLRFTAQLEVNAKSKEDVTVLLPRIMDVLNGYLRAVDVAQLQDPSALIRLRAQMLRRVQIVTGDGRVRDLLITEFVLS